MRTFYAIKDNVAPVSTFLNLNHLRIIGVILIQLDQLIVNTSSCTSQNDINSAGIAGAVLQHLVNQTVWSNWRSDHYHHTGYSGNTIWNNQVFNTVFQEIFPIETGQLRIT